MKRYPLLVVILALAAGSMTSEVFNSAITLNTTNINFFVGWNMMSLPLLVADTYAPQINLISPGNNSIDEDGNVTFTFTISDWSEISNCSMFLNGSLYQTNATVNKTLTQQFVKNDMQNGYYSWSVNCTDASNFTNTGVSALWIFRVFKPVVYSEMVNTTANTTKTVNATGTDTVLEINTIAGVTNANVTVTSYATSPTNTSLSIPSIGKNIRINASSSLEANLSFIILKIYYTDSEISGLNESTLKVYWYNGTWQDLNATINETDNYLQINLTHFSDYSLGARDTTPPAINLTSPGNGTTDTDGNVSFQYTVYDFYASVSNCTLFVNNATNQSDTTITENAVQEFALTNLSNGNYTWSINCTDSYGNVASSPMWLVIVNISCNHSCQYCGVSNCNTSAAGCYWDPHVTNGTCRSNLTLSCVTNCSLCSDDTTCNATSAQGGCAWDSYEDRCYLKTNTTHCSYGCNFCTTSSSCVDRECEWDSLEDDVKCYPEGDANHCSVTCGECDSSSDCDKSPADCRWVYSSWYDEYECAEA